MSDSESSDTGNRMSKRSKSEQSMTSSSDDYEEPKATPAKRKVARKRMSRGRGRMSRSRSRQVTKEGQSSVSTRRKSRGRGRGMRKAPMKRRARSSTTGRNVSNRRASSRSGAARKRTSRMKK